MILNDDDDIIMIIFSGRSEYNNIMEPRTSASYDYAKKYRIFGGFLTNYYLLVNFKNSSG
jgi:hypothetical protein